MAPSTRTGWSSLNAGCSRRAARPAPPSAHAHFPWCGRKSASARNCTVSPADGGLLRWRLRHEVSKGCAGRCVRREGLGRHPGKRPVVQVVAVPERDAGEPQDRVAAAVDEVLHRLGLDAQDERADASDRLISCIQRQNSCGVMACRFGCRRQIAPKAINGPNFNQRYAKWLF